MMSVMIVESTARMECTGMMVRCQCCNTPLFEIAGDRILVKAKHHGEWHVTSLSFKDIFWYNQGQLKTG